MLYHLNALSVGADYDNAALALVKLAAIVS